MWLRSQRWSMERHKHRAAMGSCSEHWHSIGFNSTIPASCRNRSSCWSAPHKTCPNLGLSNIHCPSLEGRGQSWEECLQIVIRNEVSDSAEIKAVENHGDALPENFLGLWWKNGRPELHNLPSWHWYCPRVHNKWRVNGWKNCLNRQNYKQNKAHHLLSIGHLPSDF